MYKPYSVVAPPFNLLSGGIRVMYALYGWLLAKGQVCYLNATYEDKNFVAIYPEIYRGNMTHAKNVVRYILAKPGYLRLYGVPGPKTFDKGDKIFVFSEIYNEFGADKDHVMFLPVLNMHLFKDQGKQRIKTCYYVGKGINLEKHPKDAIPIDANLCKNQQVLADTLNECQVMYGYEAVTAMYEIARLCGVRVIVIPEGHYTKKDWKKYEPGMNGITWGDEPEVKLDIEEFRNHYASLREAFSKKLDKFISITQND